MSSKPELLPCPFCGDGSSLMIEHLEGTIIHPAHRVRCDNCGASIEYTDHDHVAIWNRRAQPAGEGARGKLGHVAAIAHNGGLAGLTEHQAIVAIRRLTISAWDKSGSEEQLRQRVDAAMKGGEEGNG